MGECCCDRTICAASLCDGGAGAATSGGDGSAGEEQAVVAASWAKQALAGKAGHFANDTRRKTSQEAPASSCRDRTQERRKEHGTDREIKETTPCTSALPMILNVFVILATCPHTLGMT